MRVETEAVAAELRVADVASPPAGQLNVEETIEEKRKRAERIARELGGA